MGQDPVVSLIDRSTQLTTEYAVKLLTIADQTGYRFTDTIPYEDFHAEKIEALKSFWDEGGGPEGLMRDDSSESANFGSQVTLVEFLVAQATLGIDVAASTSSIAEFFLKRNVRFDLEKCRARIAFQVRGEPDTKETARLLQLLELLERYGHN